MEPKNNLIDIIKKAMIKENRARVFYLRLAEESQSEELKKMFTGFAEEEEGHFNLLNKKLTLIKHQKKMTFFPETDDFIEKYHEEVWKPELIKELNNASYLAAAISAAATVEDEASRFYEKASEDTDVAEAKAMLKWLSQWEREHFKLLKRMDDALTEEIWHDNRFWPEL